MSPSMDRISKIAIVLFSIVLLSCSAVLGQSGTGFPSFATISNGVDLNNLNFHLQFPIVDKPGRGMPFHYSLDYDSTILAIGDSFDHAPNWGWASSYNVGYITYSSGGGDSLVPVSYVDSRGTHHPFSYMPVDPNNLQATTSTTDQSGYVLTFKMNVDTTCQSQPCPGNTLSIVSFTNTSGDSLVVPFALLTNNGVPTPPVGPASITDRNGNVISTDGRTYYTDTLGVTVLSISQSTDSSGNLVSKTYTYNTTGGNTASIVVNYKNYSGVVTKFQCYTGGNGELNVPNVSLVDSIVYANGSKYSFQYEPTPGMPGYVTGRLATLTLPTGGTISYAYPGPNGGLFCGDYSVAHMTRTTSDGTWRYDRTEDTSTPNYVYTTTVTDPQGNQTVSTFQGDFYNYPASYETQRQIYQGSASSGTLLQTVITCYNGNNSNCPSQPVTAPITEQNVFEALPIGINLRWDTFRDAITGVVTEKDDYDWGAPGALARKTLYQYTTLGNITNLPLNVTVTDPSGTQAISQTFYNYDETSVTATSGLPQHVAITGLRGNLTSVKRTLTSNSSTVNTIYTYDDAGNALSMTDPNGNTTKFSYGNSGAYVTQINLPDTSSPNLTHHQASAIYDTNSGLLLSVTDENSHQTRFFYDSVLRPTETDYADGGKTKITYWTPNSTSVQQLISTADPSRMTFSASLTDAYGRPSRTAVLNDEGGFDQQDTCYDSDGRIGFTSYPYQGSGWQTPQVCSRAGDSFVYDALGRILGATHSDGTSIQYAYTGRAVQVADEGNGNGSTRVKHITQSDGLGRLTSVCEVSGASQLGNGGTPGSCGQDIPATGFLTSYSYSYDNSGNQITNVNQGSLYPRTFVNDSLGRLISETEPEWATSAPNYFPAVSTATYVYDNDGLLVRRTRPKPNQFDPTVTTTTNYVYDPMGRLVQRWYSDSTTPNAYFNYDETTPAGLFTATNSIGRLTSEHNNSGTAEAFSYDLVGRLISEWQCPDRCIQPSAYRQVSYGYDQIGNMTSENFAATWSYGYNIAGRPVSVTSSLADANHPGTLLSAVHYNAFGGQISARMGNFTSTTGLLETDGYDARGRFNHISTSVNTPTGNVGLLGSDYTFAPNNNLITLGDAASGTWMFAYDDFNRLKTTSVPTYGGASGSYSYGYDRFSNRMVQTGARSWSQSFDQYNHIVGWSYDADGNLLNDHAHSYTYDAEGRMLTVDGGSANGGTTYIYDADQRRVARLTGSSLPSYFLYDLAGRVVEQYDSASDRRYETYVGGRHLAIYINGTVYFSSQDRLGTERVRTTQDGSGIDSCINLPFGDGKMCWGNAAWQSGPLYFADNEYDSESGLDHMGFRQYSSTQGRFMTPDPLRDSMDFANPQSLNRYAYVFNNPLNATDPTGLDGGYCEYNGVGSEPTDPTSCAAKGGSWNTDGVSLNTNPNLPANCVLDGMETPCDEIPGMMQGSMPGWGPTVECPQCGPLDRVAPNGTISRLTFVPAFDVWTQTKDNNTPNGDVSDLAAEYIMEHHRAGWGFVTVGHINNGDTQLGMDILHCPDCAQKYGAGANMANALLVGTAAVPALAIGAGIALEAAPVVASNVAANPIVNNFLFQMVTGPSGFGGFGGPLFLASMEYKFVRRQMDCHWRCGLR